MENWNGDWFFSPVCQVHGFRPQRIDYTTPSSKLKLWWRRIMHIVRNIKKQSVYETLMTYFSVHCDKRMLLGDWVNWNIYLIREFNLEKIDNYCFYFQRCIDKSKLWKGHQSYPKTVFLSLCNFLFISTNCDISLSCFLYLFFRYPHNQLCQRKQTCSLIIGKKLRLVQCQEKLLLLEKKQRWLNYETAFST